MRQEITWKIGGIAGAGIKVTGDAFARACTRAGWYVFDYSEYPSLIRGGHNSYHVRAGVEPVYSTVREADVLVALNAKAIRNHLFEINPGGAVIFDSQAVKPDEVASHRSDISYMDVPLAKLATQAGGQELMANSVALGASWAVFKGPLEIIQNVLADGFKSKGEVVIKSNQAAAQAGYEYVKARLPKLKLAELKPQLGTGRILLPGNEALALGALANGLNFFAGYPMTPSTSIFHFMAQHGLGRGVIFKQTEDEISAVNMAIGAAYAGARSMTATSGGGFSLMVEALGLAGITETPLVIVNSQRPGPATGLPTWTEQADLRFLLHAAQGEFPRIVLAPGDVEECFRYGAEALNYAEQYQTPVLILLDKYLSESQMAVEPFNQKLITVDRGKLLTRADAEKENEFRRYQETPDGISKRSRPGLANTLFIANSDEHNDYGYSEESAENRRLMMDKRFRKLQTAEQNLSRPVLHGPDKADVTLVGWGSTLGPMLDALKRLTELNISANILRPVILEPFPSDFIKTILRQAKTTVLVENNSQGQLGGLIREKTGFEIGYQLLKYDGRPFFPDEIAAGVKSFVS